MKTTKSNLDHQQGRTVTGCLAVFGLVFLLVGLIGLWFSCLRPTLQTLQAAAWPTTKATITHCKVVESRDSDGSSYKPDIHFTYEVNGQQYTSRTWSFSVWSASRKWAKRVTDRFPLRSQHDCYYNPQSVEEAILDRNFQWSNLLGLFTLVFVFVGGGMVWYACYGVRSPSADHSAGSVISEIPWREFEGPQRLKPKTSRLAVFVGTFLLAAFWNLISWPLFILALQDHGWFSLPGIFLTFFVIVGTGLLAGAFYNFLALFNPVVTVAMSSGAVALGETVDIAWELQGKSSRIAELTIEMVGLETAIYMRGTSTRTDEKEFQRILVLKSSDPVVMQFGSLSRQVPADTMHTFLASKNKIEWSIEVRGVIHWWPDLRESLSFYVKPAGSEESSS